MAKANDTAPEDPAIRFLLAAKRLRVRDLSQLVTVSGLVGELSGLIHSLQRERGASNVYLGSAGTRFADRRAAAVAASRAGERTVRALLDGLEEQMGTASFTPRLFSRIAFVLHGFAALGDLRGRVAALRVTPDMAIQSFNEIIGGLLAIAFEATDTDADPAVSRALVAMFHFMQGKEFAGQERATAAAGFSAGRFTEAQHRRLLTLIAAQARSLQTFAQFASPSLVALSDGIPGEPGMAEFERLRRIACEGGLSGDLKGVESSDWFDRATARMDAMWRVEEQIDSDLRALCLEKLAEARADLDDHRTHLDELASAGPRTVPTAIVIGELAPSLVDDAARTGMDVISVGGLSPKLGRSLLDLVQSQYHHLQRMSEELETARLAINERKVVERAKGLLMTHRNLTEQQAYDFLRKTAMSQNRRMKDVADAVLAMAEILSP